MIDLRRPVQNQNHRFGQDAYYFRGEVITARGERMDALFTGHQVSEALARATQNQEDVPRRRPWYRILWEMLHGVD